MNEVNIAVVGLGYWGPNLARNFSTLNDAALHTICDADEKRLQWAGSQFGVSRLQTDYEQLLNDSAIDAVVIATPAATHYQLAREALLAEKHVLVEKPLAMTSAECRELVDLAEKQNKVLMNGHVFLYNSAVHEMKKRIQDGEIGEIYYIYSSRLSLGRIRQDVNALWNFAPHDVSIILHLMETMPSQVSAQGFSYLQEGIEDVVFATLRFANGVGSHIHISWLDPRKVRMMTVIGSKKMIVYDDASPDSKIQIFDKGVSKKPLSDDLGSFQSFGEFQLLLRAGDLVVPKINFVEPLKTECQHFIECIRESKKPISDGEEALRVVQVLEAAQRSIKSNSRLEVIDDTQKHI